MELSRQQGFYLTRKQAAFFIVALVGFSFLLRMTVAVGYYNSFDTMWYKNWAVDINNGLFDIYERAKEISLDYPPVYLFCLALTGKAYNFFGVDADGYTQMFIMKFWPVVFDCVMIWFLYHIFSKTSLKKGILAATFWAINPSVFFNTSMWGQTDQLMCLLLIASFVLAYDKRPVAACALFAIAGMTKFQCLYFTPILLLVVFYESGWRNLLKGMGAAAVCVILVFLPFMIGSKEPMLFLKVYTGGANTYPYATLNAFNLYGCLRLNWIEENIVAFGNFSYANLSTVFIFFTYLGTVVLFVFGKRRCGYVGCLFVMQCLFMLTTRMHERYQIVVLPFALMAWLIHKEKNFLALFWTLTVMTLTNQALLLFKINNSNCLWEQSWDTVMQVLSFVNMAVFVWSAAVCICFFLKSKTTEEVNE